MSSTWGGQTYMIPGTSARFRVSGGAIRVLGGPSDPERLYALTATRAGQIAGNQFVAGSEKYTLSDSVIVYEFRDGRYYLSTLARAEESGGTLTAWYDKAEAQGGRVRVIIVK